jgi:ADP-ribose pyrophosphatase YjhB (NUDIX family)|tara:strand:- start:2456 stop:2977 length:522 start_codon:yes stop_codon:yes gene_type:complete
MSSKIAEKIEKPIEETKKVIKKIQEDVETDYKEIKEFSDKAKRFVFEQPLLYIKAFIVDDDKKLLIIKTKNKPDKWDLPIGLIKEDENPIKWIPKIIKEEVGLDVEVSRLLGVEHVIEKSTKRFSINIYLCHPLNVSITLNQRFLEFKWIPINKAKEILGEPFLKEIDSYERS